MLKLHVEDYRAIASAEIELHDLTVLAGVNASGKSSLVRLFHAAVEGCRNQEQLTVHWIASDCLFPFLGPFFETFQERSEWSELLRVVRTQVTALWESKDISEEAWQSFYALLERLFEHLKTRPTGEQEALRRALEERLEPRGSSLGGDFTSIVKEMLCDKMDEAFRLFNGKESRNEQFGSAFAWCYHDLLRDESEGALIRISDGETVLLDTMQQLGMRGGVAFSPNKSFYIEKPSVTIPLLDGDKLRLGKDEYPIGKSSGEVENIFASFNQRQRAPSSLSALLSGDVRAPDFQKRVIFSDWRYERADRASFALDVCAEGIKSLASLQILERMGLLDANTLLIIDEPETHLHPQWIVGCAKALIELIQRYNCRILVATHSPYMVRALQRAMVKSLGPERSCIYLAEADEKAQYQFRFRCLGHDIAPIYRTFNAALDKIAFFEEPAE